MEINQIDKEFVNTLFDSYIQIIDESDKGKESTRSSKKVDPIHGKIEHDVNELISQHSTLNGNFQAFSREAKKKETNIKGRFYYKHSDITIVDLRRKTPRPVAVIEFRFVLSSFNKNKTNYFEQGLGECVNIRLANIDYYDVNVYFKNTPSFKSFQNEKIISSIDKINQESFDNLKKRSEYMSMHKQEVLEPYAPNASLIIVLNGSEPIKNENRSVFYVRTKENLGLIKKHSLDAYDYDITNSFDWNERIYINEYENFLKNIINNLLKGKTQNEHQIIK